METEPSCTLHVAIDRCETCIFRVRYPKSVRDRIFGETFNDDHIYISCHQFSEVDDETCEERSDVVCRGFYDRDPYHSVSMRIAALLGLVEFVDTERTPIACPINQKGIQVCRTTTNS